MADAIQLAVASDPEEASVRAAAALAAAARTGGSISLAGSNTPRRSYELLAAEPGIDWSQVHIWFGDERCVPPDDPESNYRMTRETLFEPLGIPAANIFRIRGEDEPQAAAAAYAEVLVRELGSRPRFDLLYLGMGPDGHTASIFPGTLAKIDDSKLVVANWVEKFNTWRITLTPHVINDATHVVITAGGAAKADALHGVLDGPKNPDIYPVQLVAPEDGELHWFIDEAAGAKLVRRPAEEARSSSGSRH